MSRGVVSIAEGVAQVRRGVTIIENAMSAQIDELLSLQKDVTADRDKLVETNEMLIGRLEEFVSNSFEDEHSGTLGQLQFFARVVRDQATAAITLAKERHPE